MEGLSSMYAKRFLPINDADLSYDEITGLYIT